MAGCMWLLMNLPPCVSFGIPSALRRISGSHTGDSTSEPIRMPDYEREEEQSNVLSFIDALRANEQTSRTYDPARWESPGAKTRHCHLYGSQIE